MGILKSVLPSHPTWLMIIVRKFTLYRLITNVFQQKAQEIHSIAVRMIYPKQHSITEEILLFRVIILFINLICEDKPLTSAV